MLAAALLALATGAGSGSAEPVHPNSISSLEIEVQDEAVQLRWWIQSRTLMEEPDVEFVGTDIWNMSLVEAETAWPRIRPYLEEGFTILVDGEPWQPSFDSFELQLEGGTFFVQTQLLTQSRAERIEVRIDHFFDGANPEHIMDTRVFGLSDEVDRWFFMWGRREAQFPVPREPGYSPPDPFRYYIAIGWRHVLDGWDHLAFLGALLFGVLGWRALLGAITGFTVAHSITLGLTAARVLDAPAAFVEPGIAFSISAVLWWHLARGPARSRAWIPAFGFGLLHGCSFATQLTELRIPDEDFLSTLLGFNVGVELGQLSFVLPVLATVYFAGRLVGPTHINTAKRWSALLLAAFGLVLFGRSIDTSTQWLDDSALEQFTTVISLLLLSALAALALGKRKSQDGEPLRVQLGAATLVASLYLTGTWLGS